MSCVHGGREWGANAEIELQDCGCPQSKFSHGSREHRRHQLLSKKSNRFCEPKKRDEKKNDPAKNDMEKNDETSHEVTETIADAA